MTNLQTPSIARRAFLLGAGAMTLTGCVSTPPPTIAVAPVDTQPDRPATPTMYEALPYEQFPIPRVDVAQVGRQWWRTEVDYPTPENLLAKDVQRSFRAAPACWPMMGKVRCFQVVLEMCDKHSLAVRANEATGKSTARLRDVEKLLRFRVPPVNEACTVIAILAADFRIVVTLMNRHWRTVSVNV